MLVYVCFNACEGYRLKPVVFLYHFSTLFFETGSAIADPVDLSDQ